MSAEPIEILLRQRRRMQLRLKDEDAACAWAAFYLSVWDAQDRLRVTGYAPDEMLHLLDHLSGGSGPDAMIATFAQDALKQLHEGGDPRRKLKYAHGDPLLLTVTDIIRWAMSSPAKQKARIQGIIDSVLDQYDYDSDKFITPEGNVSSDQVTALRLGFDREYDTVAEAIKVFLRWKIDSFEYPPFEEWAKMRAELEAKEGAKDGEANPQQDGGFEPDFDEGSPEPE